MIRVRFFIIATALLLFLGIVTSAVRAQDGVMNLTPSPEPTIGGAQLTPSPEPTPESTATATPTLVPTAAPTYGLAFPMILCGGSNGAGQCSGDEPNPSQ